MQRQRPWQKQVVLQQKKASKHQGTWIIASILLGGLISLVVLIGVVSPASSDQPAIVPAPTAGNSQSSEVSQSPAYSAVKGMWLGADERIWFQTLGEPLARQTMGTVVVLTMALTHTQGIGVLYLEEWVGTHTIIAIDEIAPTTWGRQDGVSLCDTSAGEEVNLSRPIPLQAPSEGFSQMLTVPGASIQGSMSVFYFQGNPQAIKACTASLGSHITQTYTPPV